MYPNMADSNRLPTEPYKGVRDFYPEDEAVQKYLFSTMRGVAERFGYVEYDASVLESAELYRAKGAENEEIANEQTYTFTDRGDREVTLRPEMTPTVARMVAAKRRELPFPLRWYSIPNVFRYERPQRGRLREHWQLNVDLFGSHSPAADAEVIMLAHALMREFGAQESDFQIRVSSRQFVQDIAKRHDLSPENHRAFRLLLDRHGKISKEEHEEELKKLGISPEEFAASNPPEDVAALLEPLRQANIGNVAFDPHIVRGFDYYTGMVFEVFDTHPENNRSLFGGGRYDNLLDMFGEHVPAVGFGMGDVTMRDFLAVREKLPTYASPVKVYLAVPSSALAPEAMKLAAELRRAGVNTAVDFGDKKLEDQIKAADKQRIPYLIVVGENELGSGEFKVRDLAAHSEKPMRRDDLSSFFLNL
jgi:histidyl-tRNA synthetase